MEGRPIAEAFARRQVVGHEYLGHVFVGDVVEIDLPWQPKSEPAIGILDPALLPGCIDVAKVGGHVENLAEPPVPSKLTAVVKGDRLAQAWIQALEDGHDHARGLGSALAGQSGGEGQPGLAFVQDQHGTGALAEDQITFPMSERTAIIDLFGSVVNGRAVLYAFARWPRL